MRRVVVTGLGALTPIGNTVNDFWDNSLAGVSGANYISKFDTSLFKTNFACELKDFNALDFFSVKEVRMYDDFTKYALVAVDEAVKNSCIEFDSVDKNRVGVIWGSGNGGVSTFEEQFSEFISNGKIPRFNPYFMPRILVDIAAGVISIKYGLKGVNYCPVSACASATTAVIDAFNQIKWNKADIIITGGSEAPICPSTIGGFGSARALSTKNEDPSTASRPFDLARDGFVMGEGAGAIILEELDHAKKRGAQIYAEIVGGGMCADAYHLTNTHPDGDGAARGMELAIEESGIDSKQVGYVNMHATSTPQGDLSELKAITKVFGSRNDLVIGATKSMTGHLLGAAGAIESILTIKVLETQLSPPLINSVEIEPSFANLFNFSLNTKANLKTDYALNNTFGFGGHIASVLFKKWKGE